jgi:hypothetical protein
MDAVTPDVVAIRTHLTLLFGAAIDEGLFFSIFCLPSRSARFFNEVEPAVDWSAKQAAAGQHVYCGMGLFEKPVAEGRGLAADVKGIVGFWTDIDILDPNAHKGKDYPATIAEANSIATVGGFPPSFKVNSGFGLHGYWLFKEPRIFASDTERLDTAVLVARWNGTVQANARAIGKVVDAVHDLARVLRVAGTINWKQKDSPRPVLLEAPANPTRFLVDDLEPLLVATEYVKQGAEMIGDVALFTIDPNVRIPGGMITAITANNNELSDTWHKKRVDFKDQSPSSYDMSLANTFVKMGFDDQQIVDLLVYWRREIAKAPKLRVDYYQRTIGKCRATQQADEAIKVFDQPGEMPQTSSPEMLTAGDRQKLLNAIRGALMINVQKFVQLNKDNAEYFIVLDNGEEFSVGRVSSITRFHLFRDRLLERCNVMVPSDRQERWPKVVVALFSIVERKETEDPRTQDRTLGYITDYLENVKIFQEDEWEGALAEDYPMVRAGKVWVNKRHFIRWCATNRGIKMTEAEAERDFHMLRMERERHEGVIKNRTRRPWFWGLPMDEFNAILTTKRRSPKRGVEG